MSVPDTLDLRPGDSVEVRSPGEILATLDDAGALDSLPFMPEMLALCGKRFQVQKRSDSTCDTVSATGMRRMDRTVHLAGLRCDGSCHGGCQAGCLLFWKEAWLKRVPPKDAQTPPADASSQNGNDTTARDPAWLESRTVQGHTEAGEIRYQCQATELKKASRPLPWWKPGQYLRDIFVNKISPVAVVRGFVCAVLNKVRRRLTGRGVPNTSGPLTRTPAEELDLQPGEWVTIKSKEEIIATLDKKGRNRGLTFDGEMIPYCGKRFRVLRRVEKIIEESTGRLIKPKGVSVILENVICLSRYRRPCPRAIYSYWREIWLRRDTAPESQDECSKQSVSNAEPELATANSAS